MFPRPQYQQVIDFLLAADDADLAQQLARKYLQIYPNTIEAADMLAYTLVRAKKNFNEAAEISLKILQALPDDIGAMANAAKSLNLAGRADEAEMIARRMLEKRPNWLDAELELSLFLSMQGKLKECADLLLDLKQRYPDNDLVEFNLGWHYLHQGDFRKGMSALGVGRKLSVWGSYSLNLPFPKWNGEDLQGKTLLIACEGGYGDEIIASKFVNDISARGAKVIVRCRKDLKSIFSRIKSVHRVITQDELPSVTADFWVAGMDVARAGNYTYETLPTQPYLTASPEFLAKWNQKLGPKKKALRVGIRWQGNPEFEHEQMRTIDINEFMKILDAEDVEFFSLQKDFGTEFFKHSNMQDLSSDLQTWEDTAAVINQMDLVISSCTSVAHMSAALGQKTWVLVPIMPYYIWAEPGSKSRWYSNNVTVYRQTVYRSWSEPCQEILQDLRRLKNPN